MIFLLGENDPVNWWGIDWGTAGLYIDIGPGDGAGV